MKTTSEKTTPNKEKNKTEKAVSVNQMPEDKRDTGNSMKDWNAEQNESGRRK